MNREIHRPGGCPSDFAFDKQLAGELDATEKSVLEKHTVECERCTRRLVELSGEKETFVRQAPALVLPRRPRSPARWLWGPGAAVVAAAAAILLTMRAPADTTRTKGRPATLDFYVSHAGTVRAGAPGERLEPGDALRFAVTTREPRYVAIFSVDGARHASVYYPGGARAAPVSPGERTPLPASTVLDDTLGDETLYAVFCARSFEIGPLLESLSGAVSRRAEARALDNWRIPDDCDLDATRVHKARRQE